MEPNADVAIKIKQEVPTVPVNNIIANELKPNRFGASSRLPSFKSPRDLTLSALASTSCIPPQFARTKKTFQPNIPVRREKGDRVVESKSEKSLKRNSNKAKLDHGRGRAKFKEKEFVQTKGSLFGEGIAATHPKRISSSSYRIRGDGVSGSVKGEIQKPVLNPDAGHNINKDLEEQRLKEILRDNFIDDVEEIVPEDSMPVQLPMVGLCNGSQLKEEDLGDLKKDSCGDTTQGGYNFGVQVKEEPGTEGSRKKEKINGLVHHPAIHSDSFSQPESVEGSVAHLLSKSMSDFMLFQLPSCLPGHPPEVKAEPQPQPSSNSASKEQSVGSSDDASKASLCSLSTLPEGQIGSIKIYESGKVVLCLGNHNLEINQGTQVGFLQDVVRVEADAESGTGSMVVLGHIKDRLVCTPDFNSLTRNLKLS